MITREKAIKQLAKIEKIISKSKQPRLAVEWKENWKSLISTILSSQTRDTTTIKYSEILYKKYPTIKSLSKARVSDVKKIIKPINFHKTKAKHITETAKILTNKRSIPDTRKELMELPGVGRKVANVYLVHAHNAAAIGVDTHVAQTSRKLGWSKNKNPHKIEKDLEILFPKRYWNKINWIIVRFGQMYSKKEKDKILNKI